MNNTLTVQESYDKIAKYFSVTRVFTWNWTNNFIDNLNKNSIILDIGCGSGRNMNFHNHITHGIDLSLEQLKQCSNSKLIVQANMINIPFKDKYFDSIISIASFHHLSTVIDRHRCLQEMKRILNKNGNVLLSVWSINQPKKTKRIFQDYGDNIVEWNTNTKDDNGNPIIIPRYYYIFKLEEIKKLIQEYFIIEKYYWDCGNEIFELINK